MFNVMKLIRRSRFGLSTFAGYAVDYQVGQSFKKNNNVGVEEATLFGTNEIINVRYRKSSDCFRTQ
ncbi:hypothetical protein [Clostridium formicaceticum]|uniref:hypothetical protein n=1 Tax=Clostridium formicaceticum TaxID=1497 RepID=UPI0009DA27A8|nr:hypothetical protein [Clostridium formicaceticum]